VLFRSRRLAAVAAVLSSSVALSLAPPVVTPAHAASSNTVADRKGDVKSESGAAATQPEADIVSAGAEYRGSDLVFSLLVDRPTDPATTKNWANSTAGWGLDTNGDNAADYLVALGRDDNNRVAVEVGKSNDDSGATLCTGTFAFGPQQAYTATIPAGCVGGPAAFRYIAVMAWDTNPDDENAPVVGDTAPELGSFAGPVEAPPGTPTGPGATPSDKADPNLTKEAGGYWLAGDDGGVFSFNSDFYGSTGAIKLAKPIVALVADPSGPGYWFVASDGGIFSFGHAGFFGSAGSTPLNKPIVGLAATPSGRGYWLVASDGGIFSYGDARFWGSTGAIRLNQAIVGIASTPTGLGYWLVASDGGVFAFGDAKFWGSTGSLKLNQPIVAAAATRTGNGYWFVARDGGVFSFGDAAFYGAATGAGSPVVGFAPARDGAGYSIARADGTVAHIGSAPKAGSLAGQRLNRPIVAIAATP
jgi:ribosomal protein L24E